MNELCLDNLTATDVPPPQLVRIAAENRVHRVSLMIQSAGHSPTYGLIGDAPMRRETRAALRSCGVELDLIESFYLKPENPIESFRPAIESGVWLQARNIAVVCQDGDRSRLQDRFAAFCELAREYGLGIFLEYTPRMTQRTFAEALQLLRLSGQSGVRITADALHTFRGGTPLAHLAAVGAEILGRAQLCDGPSSVTPELARHEAVYERVIPGQGALPLQEFVSVLPEDIVIGLEVPMQSWRERGVSAAERVRRVVEGARRLVEARGARGA